MNEFFQLDFFSRMAEYPDLTVILAAADAQDGPMPDRGTLFMKQGLLTAQTLAQFISIDPGT